MPADEIRFPEPLPARKAPEPVLRAPEPTPRRVVVQRSEVAVEADPTGTPALSHEEMRALLAVHAAVRPTPGKRTWRRGRILVLPMGLFDLAAHAMLGDHALWVIGVATVAALAWIARPLMTRDGFAEPEA